MITLTGITKRYGARTAVDDLSLHVTRGEVLGLLGPNGAGKSTTMHVAAGLLAPDAGTVDLDGRGSTSRPEVCAALGLAPQSLAVYDLLSAEENLRFFADLYGLPGERASARVEWALTFAGLADRRRDRVATFSGGGEMGDSGLRRGNLARLLAVRDAVAVRDPAGVRRGDVHRGQPGHGIARCVPTLSYAGRTLALHRSNDYNRGSGRQNQ